MTRWSEMSTAIETRRQESYLAAFSELSKRTDWLHATRADAFERFWELGFPTIHDEDWRFTSVAPIAGTGFELAPRTRISAESVFDFRIPGIVNLLVFINGRFAAEHSQVGALPKGVKITSLADASAGDRGLVEPYLARYAEYRNDAFLALNTAFIADGAFVWIPKGVVLEDPIHILYVTTASDQPLMSHPRNLIICGENSQATVLEDYVSIDGADGLPGNVKRETRNAPAFTNAVTELIAGEHSVISHYMLEREDTRSYNISTLRLQQERSAHISSHSVLVGGGLVRNNVHPVLAGEGGDCLINGLFLGRGHQHMDNYMLVEHAQPHCSSRQFYNGILDGHSRGVFHGRIIVHKDAQKTDAKQTNRNLLLSDEAQIDTKPQLEIYADDVKCTHGATIGQIEEESLFYMRSRGLPETEARALLLYAFASECLDRMNPGPVRDFVAELVPRYLPSSGGPLKPSVGLSGEEPQS